MLAVETPALHWSSCASSAEGKPASHGSGSPWVVMVTVPVVVMMGVTEGAGVCWGWEWGQEGTAKGKDKKISLLGKPTVDGLNYLL